MSSPKPARALRQTTSITRLCNRDVQEPYSQDASVTVHTAAPARSQEGQITATNQHRGVATRRDVLLTCSDSSSLLYLNPTVNKKILNSIKCLKWAGLIGAHLFSRSDVKRLIIQALCEGNAHRDFISALKPRPDLRLVKSSNDRKDEKKKKKTQNNNGNLCVPHMLCFQRSCAMTEKALKCLLWHNMRETVRVVTQKRGRLQEKCVGFTRRIQL